MVQFRQGTKDYLFRHDRGSFWMASYRVPEALGRWMDPLLDSSSMFRLANALPWAFPKQVIGMHLLLPLEGNTSELGPAPEWA